MKPLWAISGDRKQSDGSHRFAASEHHAGYVAEGRRTASVENLGSTGRLGADELFYRAEDEVWGAGRLDLNKLCGEPALRPRIVPPPAGRSVLHPLLAVLGPVLVGGCDHSLALQQLDLVARNPPPSIENQPGVTAYVLEVEAVVVSEEHHGIGRGDLLWSGVDANYSGIDDLRLDDVWVGSAHLRPQCEQPVGDDHRR